MNRIQELIKELCPNGVEWKTLGEIGKISMCKRIMKNETSDSGDIPFYKIGSFGGIADSFISRDLFEKYKKTYSYPKKGEILLSASGTIGKSVIFDGTPSYFQDSNIVWISNDEKVVFNKYLYYYYQIAKWNISSGGTIARLYNDNLAKTPIQIPPLPVQTEIVRILDKFVEQQEQLEKLIELRTKQYEYYREEMLTAKEGEEWTSTTLGEIGTFVRGNGLQKTDFTEDGVGCIHYGQIYTYYGMFTKTTKSFVSSELASKLKKVEPGDIVLACTSENIEDVCKCVVWEGNDSIVTGGHASIYKHKENPRFIAYFLKTKAFETQKIKYAYGAKVIDIKNDDLEKIIINLPSRAKQDQIVNAINNFESSISALTSALELSKKRYEHYRDEMLRF